MRVASTPWRANSSRAASSRCARVRARRRAPRVGRASVACVISDEFISQPVGRNAIIAARNRVDEAWSGIDVQLERRRDLIPNLVETVKGYAAHEQRVFDDVTRACADALRATGLKQTEAAEQ